MRGSSRWCSTRRSKWETAFDALSEGIAVVDDHGCISRANRALAAMLGAPVPAVIGCDLGEALIGPSPPCSSRSRRPVTAIGFSPWCSGRRRSAARSASNAARIPAPAHDQSVVVLVEGRDGISRPWRHS